MFVYYHGFHIIYNLKIWLKSKVMYKNIHVCLFLINYDMGFIKMVKNLSYIIYIYTTTGKVVRVTIKEYKF